MITTGRTLSFLIAMLAFAPAARAARAKHVAPPPPPRADAIPNAGVAAPAPPATPATDPYATIFATPDGLQDAVGFWENVYAKFSTRMVVMHDNRYLGITYGVLDYSYLEDGKKSDPEIDRMIDDGVESEKKRIVLILKELASYRGSVPEAKLTPEAKKIYKAFEPVDELDKFELAAERVRGQRGQKDKFLKGIADVAPYMPRMEQSFRSRGLPGDLARLTFVESMFNLRAYSKVGAAGPWQFMSGTGRLFLTITPEIDERMDPLRAADAAARLLGGNYRELGNWGLALTAYNHGVGGMRRAVREVGSDDIGQIVWAYDQRSFGFASRNFYAEFLAARDVYNNRAKYFGAQLALNPPKTAVTWDEVILPEHVSLQTFAAFCGVSDQQLRDLNPALTQYVFSGAKYLPKGYPIKVPEGQAKSIVAAYARIPKEMRFGDQKPNEFHTVKRGDTMVAIAKKYSMSVDSLMNMNSLGAGNRLRAGQKLRVLPSGKPITGTAVAAADKQPAVKILPAVKLAEDKTPPPTELSAEEAEVLVAAEAPAVDAGAPASATLNASASTSGATTSPLSADRPGSTLLSMVAGSFGMVSPEAALAAAAAPSETPAPMRIRDFGSWTLALLEPGANGMAAPPELSMTGATGPTMQEPSPLSALHDERPRRDRDDARAGLDRYPGGVHCALTASRVR